MKRCQSPDFRKAFRKVLSLPIANRRAIHSIVIVVRCLKFLATKNF